MSPSNHHFPTRAPSSNLQETSVSSIIAQLFRNRSKERSSAQRLNGNWSICIHASDQYWSIRRFKDVFSTSWSSKKPSEVWSILEPCECPARFIRTAVPSKEAQKALAFLIEPQLPLALEECAVVGIQTSAFSEGSEYLVSYARQDRIAEIDEGDFLFAGSLAAAALPLLLKACPHLGTAQPSHGLWLIQFPRSWMIAHLLDGAVAGVRSVPRGDLERLTMACQELGPTALRSCLGPCHLEGWHEVAGPDWLPRGSEWLGLTGFAIHLLGKRGDLRPANLTRSLDRPSVRRWLWGLTGLMLFTSLAVRLSINAFINERLAEVAIQAEQIPDEMVRLSQELTDSASPFSPEPPLPRCFQVMEWLSQIPELSHDQGLAVEKFRYQMTQYPVAGREREAYQAKVSLEISCRDAFRARKILDAISLADPLSPVDLKQPLDWSHHQGIYRLSFTLKKPGTLR